MTKKQLFLLTIILFFACNIFAQDEFTTVKEGDIAPDFTFQTLGGKMQNLSDLKGKVVWINFFATWCPPCRKELPELENEVYNKLKNNSGFELLVVGREHSRVELEKFRTEQNFTLPFVPDPERDIFSKYAKQNIPRNFIIGKDGKIIIASTGFKKKEFNEMISKVEELLK